MPPLISVIIPVWREAAAINKAVAHLKALPVSNPLEIIIVDGHPARDTIGSVTDQTVTCVTAARGRGLQMNKGAAGSNGEVLLFLHADTILHGKAMETIENTMTDSRVVAGAFNLGIASPGMAFRLIEKGVFLRTWLTKIPYGDQAIFIRRHFFIDIGGFREIPIMEDVELMQRIKKKGEKIRIIPLKAATSPRRWRKEGVIYCTLRNWSLICLYHLGVPPQKLAKFYQ